jgi:hypothetical protein
MWKYVVLLCNLRAIFMIWMCEQLALWHFAKMLLGLI